MQHSLKAIFVLAALSLIDGLGRAQSLDSSDVVGAANRWTTYGGSPSRSGATRTRAPRGSVDVAWAQDIDGTLEGEPLVWDDLVVITFARGKDVRVLRCYDLVSGKPRSREFTVRTQAPLEPSLWRDVIAYRSAPNQIEAARLRNAQLVRTWGVRTDGECGAPLLVENRVWIGSKNALSLYVVGQQVPKWTLAERSFHGRLALVGERLFAVSRAHEAGGGLIRVDASSGEITRDSTGYDITPGPATSIALVHDGAYVDLGAEQRSQSGVAARFLAFAGEQVECLGSMTMCTLPTAHGAGWIGKLYDATAGVTLYSADHVGADSLRPLASREHHTEFAQDELPLAIAGGVALVGARAFEIESSLVLWRAPLKATARAVPARDSVLIVDEGKRLVALRSRAPRPAAPIPAPVEPCAVTGTLVLRDGTVASGAFSIDPAGASVGWTKGKAAVTQRLDDVLWLEDRELRAVAGSDPLIGIELLNESRLADEYVELAKKARATNDPALIDEFADVAASHGGDEKTLKSALAHADELRQRKKPAAVNAKVVSELRGRASELVGQHARMLLERLDALPEALRPVLDTKLLRAALKLDRNDARAAERVRALLPEELRVAGAFDALDALAFVEVTRRTPVTIVRAPEKSRAGLSKSQVKVGQRLSTWRKDLYGVQSANLLIVTPVRKLGAVARCIATGELVCSMLSELIAGGAPAREADRLMEFELYESQDEYVRLSGHSRGLAGEFGADLGWTAGHFDPQGPDVTRFFFPEDEAEFEEALATAAHEMTHHWLRTRCPLWAYRTLNDENPMQPGYWVVEGFASFIDEFELDLERGTWNLGGSNSRRLDLVASAGEEQQLPWSLQFELSHGMFARIPPELTIGVPLSQRVGLSELASVHHLFYAQAAATARYLWEADNGALRPKLIEYLRAYYSGERDKLDLPKALGVETKALAERITAHARKILQGS